MKFIIQIVVFLLVLSLIPLALKLLVKSRLLPPLIWWGLGRELYPQWSAAHPFMFYGILAALAVLVLFSWLGPWLARRREEKQFERYVRDEIARADAEGRTISGFKVENGVPITIWRD